MNYQETFDEVAEALVNQGKPSTNPDKSCSYYSPDGNRCAVGWLMDEPTAKKLEEYHTGKDVYEIDRENEDYFMGYDLEFLSALQCAHDNSSQKGSWMDDWAEEMMQIADDFHLDKTVFCGLFQEVF